MNRLYFVSIVVCVVFLFSAPVSFTNADWPMFQHDPAHTGYTTVNATSTSLQELWNFSTGAVAAPPTLVEGGIVYVGSDGFFALNATTGANIWNAGRFSQPYFGVSGYPCVANGIVYFGITDHYAIASNAITGAELWNYFVSSGVSSITVANGEIFMTLAGGGMMIINASNRGEIGGFGGFSDFGVPPAVVGGVVYGADTQVYAINLSVAQGPQSLMWTYPTSSYFERSGQTSPFSFRSCPTVADGVVYIGAEYSDSSGRLWRLTRQRAFPSGTIQPLAQYIPRPQSTAITFTRLRTMATCLPSTDPTAA